MLSQSNLKRLALIPLTLGALSCYGLPDLTLAGRALVALPASEGGNFVSWRMMPDDNVAETVFELLRDGEVIATLGPGDPTSWTDAEGQPTSRYSLRVGRQDGENVTTTPELSPWSDIYASARLDRPQGGVTQTREAYSYYPGDCSVADVDADGQMELLMKWNPTNLHDNSITGQTGPVVLDCYKIPALSGSAEVKRLWRINLGTNIRAGEHYTQPVFYDLDGDGLAELICKTAPGSIDADGRYVSEAATDADIRAITTNETNLYANGVIKRGEELLTVFSGLTGRALHTVWYSPNRAGGIGGSASYPATDFWGDNYANRSERYLSCLAYLEGRSHHPSAIFCRGYYTRAYVWAVDWDGTSLSTRWLSASTSPTEMSVTDAAGQTQSRTYTSSTSGKSEGYTLYGNGAHSLAVGDVDGDDCDEIMYGAATLDNDGWLLYSTGYGHGDATHLGDFDPDRDGLEYYMVHEEGPHYGYHLCDAATGEILVEAISADDNGMGTIADLDGSRRGAEFWSAADVNLYNIQGKAIASMGSARPHKFRIYWDGDAQDELLYAATVDKWNPTRQTVEHVTQFGNYGNSTGTGDYGRPWVCLQADLLGDWREEVILWNKTDSCTLNIFTTRIPTEHSVPWLMTDHVYEMSIVWQCVGYNMPPHLSYYLDDYVTGFDPKAYKVGQYYFTGYTGNTMLVPQWGEERTVEGNTLSLLALDNEDFDQRFACSRNSDNTTWRFRDATSTQKGLYSSTAGNLIAVLGLHDGDEVQCMLCNGSLAIVNPTQANDVTTIEAGTTTLHITTESETTDLLLRTESARMYVEGFTITSRRDPSAIEQVTTSASTPSECYDLWGRRCQEGSATGITIRNGKKQLMLNN